MSSKFPLVVLSVAYPLAPVRADCVGGAEKVLAQLDSALIESGHHSIVVSCEGSFVKGRHIAAPIPKGPFTGETLQFLQQEYRHMIESVLKEQQVDLVHMHGIDFHHYLPHQRVPVLATLHLPPSWYPDEVFQIDRPSTFLNCVSRSQRQACPKPDYIRFEIENGVETRDEGANFPKQNFALAMGRICPEKGFHLALDAAKKASTPLRLAGQVFPYEAHQHYFEREIAPRLDSERQFIGPIHDDVKRCCLKAAKCLLVPSLVPETSSLVAMESLASGTPVIAFPAGALKDIVEHGKTGFLVGSVNEMAEAIHALDSLDPADCRKAALERFSLQRMISRYFNCYHQILNFPEGEHIQFNAHPC